jgi:hypothetical protein
LTVCLVASGAISSSGETVSPVLSRVCGECGAWFCLGMRDRFTKEDASVVIRDYALSLEATNNLH